MFTLFLASQVLLSVTPSPDELVAAKTWTQQAFGDPASASASAQFPFSFAVDAAPSRTVSAGTWNAEHTAVNGTVADTSIEWRCDVQSFSEFPAVEWVLHFKNTGQANSPILGDIRALDILIPLPRAKSARVRYANGSECRLDDFAPKTMALGPTEEDPQDPWRGESNPFVLESKGGRSSCGTLPFFNIDMGDHGVIGAIGWTGDWTASSFRTDEGVRVRAGLRRTHFALLPGEEVRMPRILLLFWEGNAMRGQNLLRQFILAQHRPQVNGQPAQAPITNATWGGNFVAKHIEHARWWKEQQLPLEYLWVDAGWFGKDEAKPGATVFNSQWWRYVGDWHANPGYFPEGLAPLGETLHQLGLGFVLWLEVERVYKDTPWTSEHPEWLLGPIGDNRLYNLGIPEARQWLTDFLSKLIDEGKITCYRQDFNMDPRPFWEAADAPDRVGIAEIKHITGMYAMWDELRQRHPGLLIDNCSSGGRRIDLESISRSIPLWRSDVQCFPNFGATAMQGQTQGLGAWVPLSTGACDREDTYVFRSALGPGMVLIMYDFENDTTKHFSTEWLKTRMAELESVRTYFEGDFYPLLSYSLATDGWSAWQYDRPDLKEGMVLALRRPTSPFTVMTPVLHELDPDAHYELHDADTGETNVQTGKSLMESGVQLKIDAMPGSRLITYKRQ